MLENYLHPIVRPIRATSECQQISILYVSLKALTRSLFKRDAAGNDGDSAIDDTCSTETSNGTTNDQHVGRYRGTAENGPKFEYSKEEKERPLARMIRIRQFAVEKIYRPCY